MGIAPIHHLAKPVLRDVALSLALLAFTSAIAYGTYEFSDELGAELSVVGYGAAIIGTILGAYKTYYSFKNLMWYMRGEYIFVPPWKRDTGRENDWPRANWW